MLVIFSPSCNQLRDISQVLFQKPYPLWKKKAPVVCHGTPILQGATCHDFDELGPSKCYRPGAGWVGRSGRGTWEMRWRELFVSLVCVFLRFSKCIVYDFNVFVFFKDWCRLCVLFLNVLLSFFAFICAVPLFGLYWWINETDGYGWCLLEGFRVDSICKASSLTIILSLYHIFSFHTFLFIVL